MSKDLVSTNVAKAKSALEKAREALAKTNESSVARKSFDAARDAAKHIKVGIIIDATASRQESWNAAMQAQTDIVEKLGVMADNVEIGIYYHSGDEAHKLGWFNDGGQAKYRMSRLSCVGGHTKIEESFRMLGNDTAMKKPDIVVMIGDCFEENIETTIQQARKIDAPVFAFHEKTAQSGKRDLQSYEAIANATGGACVSLGSKPEEIATYIQTAVAIKRGGADLQALSNSEAFKKLVSANPDILRLSHNKK